ncbi:hypothetical protein OROGR_006363 [Orobanche gracilis]
MIQIGTRVLTSSSWNFTSLFQGNGRFRFKEMLADILFVLALTMSPEGERVNHKMMKSTLIKDLYVIVCCRLTSQEKPSHHTQSG